jgi:NhaA family Na+:H+ antiporter
VEKSIEAKRLGSLFAGVMRPFQQFFKLEAASGILLLCSAAVALVWANSAASSTYFSVLETPLTLGVAGDEVHFTIRQLINDELMTLFFVVVGMEIKREFVMGELRTLARALLPLIAAFGGMVVPSIIYFALNRGGPGHGGWGIPMATDIAFAVGCLSLLKGRVPYGPVVFLTALAIFDDMGGILVIALFYGSKLHVTWLLGALAITGVLFALNRMQVRNGLAYGVGGLALWYALHHGGIHATISGVILGMMIPARAFRPAQEVIAALHAHTARLMSRRPDEALDNAEVLAIEERIEELESPINRFVHLLHPFVSTLIVVRLGLAPVPGGASLVKLYGVSVLGGIGFTVALFVPGLAFPDAQLLDEAKIGILLGSLASGVAGFLILRVTAEVPAGRGATIPASA